MSDKLYFKIFYDKGEIAYGPNRVDLSGFPSVTKAINRPTKAVFRGIYNWLMQGFNVDVERYELSIMAIVSHASEGICWELVPLKGNNS